MGDYRRKRRRPVRGLAWLAHNQGPEGNWESNDLGLVGMGALAFLSAGHTPGVGQYGKNVERALAYVLKNARPSGLLNIADRSAICTTTGWPPLCSARRTA